MTNLYLSYPSIQYDAKVRKQSVTFSDDRPWGNTIYNERYQYASATAGASGAINAQSDLGVGVTTAVDHVIVANAQKLITQGATSIALDACTDGIDGTYSNVWTDASFANATLRGPDSLDYITTGLSLTAKRTWKFLISGGAASTREFCKVYYGTAWNPGVDANFGYSIKKPENSTISTEDGGSRCYRLADGRYQISLEWPGVADAAAQIFADRVLENWNVHKFFLFSTGEHRILNSLRLLHVRCTAAPTISRRLVYRAGVWTGYNYIKAEFQQCLG